MELRIDKDSNFTRKGGNSPRLFFVRCNGDGSWLTSREPKGKVFGINPPDPMLVSGPMGWQGAYELIPTPWTVETWPDLAHESPVSKLEAILASRLAKHDGCSRFGTQDFAVLSRPNVERLLLAIAEAHKALGGDSNDAEHEALLALMAALGEEEA
jgi:hypothetical protein